MAGQPTNLFGAARELIEIERALGGEHLPRRRHPLPEAAAPPAEVRAAAAPQGQEGTAAADKAAALAAIDDGEVKGCTRCGLSASRHNTVFGEGDPDADLVFIGEGPGMEEDRTGRPFVGRAGELLTKMIRAMGLTRQQVFIGNLVKCRPPNNRSPAPDEVQACWDYLLRQLQIIQPKVIVALGNPATKALLNTAVGITRLRGRWQQLPPLAEGLTGVPVMPTFHPAYLLRQYTPDNRKKVWSDLQQVMERLGIEPPQR
jgi:DNA polymerase